MREKVKTRYRMFQRQGAIYYWQDSQSKQQGSLGTKEKCTALKLLHAKNEAFEQPILNLALAKAYASAHDPKMATRTWSDVMKEMTSHGKASTKERCGRAMTSKHLDLIREKILIATTSEDFLCVMHAGGNSTNHYLRRLHNLAINLGWLVSPILVKRAWPKITSARRRAITRIEQAQIISAEKNIERRNFYELLWETGCSQSDAAHLQTEDIDWSKRILSYYRMKLGEESVPAQLTIGNRLLEILQRLPASGYLFPNICKISSNHRSAEFRRRCRLLSIQGVSLHSYRHAWAQRAKSAGYPQRFAQACLGHSSRAVHEAYAKEAIVICPSLESYEKSEPLNRVAIRTSAVVCHMGQDEP